MPGALDGAGHRREAPRSASGPGGMVPLGLGPRRAGLLLRATGDGATPGRSASEGHLRCVDLSLALVWLCRIPLCHLTGLFVCPGQLAPGCWQLASRCTAALSSRQWDPDAHVCCVCAGGWSAGWGCCRTALPGASVGPAGRLPCCLPHLERQGPGEGCRGRGAGPALRPRRARHLSALSLRLCPPTHAQGVLHRYCAAVNDDEVRFDGQSQKASDSPPHRLPDNETDCGWAPFGEFCQRAVTVRPPRRAVPAGFFHG